MNPVYEAWWKATMDSRGVVRFLAERFPWSRSPAVRVRWLLHLLAGNVVVSASIVAAVMLMSVGLAFLAAVALVLAVAVGFEVWFRASYASGSWLIAWREAWRFRRRWPAEWAALAAKTTGVQAEVGTSKEPVASAKLRPVVDHPKLSMVPRIEWPVVSWWVGPPPGRSFKELAAVEVALSANVARAEQVTLDYQRETDSHARLFVQFANPIRKPIAPPWATTTEAA